MYKTKLQELCHKNTWDLPEYTSRKEGPDHDSRHHATVSINGRLFENPSPATSSKKAQNEAAKVAFDFFSSSSFNPPTPPAPAATAFVPVAVHCESTTGENSAIQAADNQPLVNVPTEVPKIDHNLTENLCKNLLQSYAQKKSLALPSYSCERLGPPHAMRFKCKVTVGGQTYESQELFTTLSKAEHAAARVALMALAPEGLEEDASAYKNLLQELAQKESYKLPVYSTIVSGEAHKPSFISTVEVNGEMFSGMEAKTKKQAELNAAKVAYSTLKQRNSRQSTPVSSFAISSAQPFDPSSVKLSQSFNDSNQIAPTPSPSFQGQSIVQSSSSSRADFAAFLYKNAPIQPELSGSDEEPQQVEENGEVSSKAQDRVVEVVCDVASLVQSNRPSSDSPMLSLPKEGGVVSFSAFGNSSSSSAISSAEPEITENILPENKVFVHPWSVNKSYPPGSTVLPFSDSNWVAVNIPVGSTDATL